jgi:hypothetical protein
MDVSTLRIVLIYIVFAILLNIVDLIKKTNIVFNKIRFSTIMGMFCWGITMATIMNLLINNPLKLYIAIIIYILCMVGGFIWGIATYSLTGKIKNKKQRNRLMVQNDRHKD